VTSYLGFMKWVSGDPDGAKAGERRVLELAKLSGDPFFLGAAQCHAARYMLLRDEPTAEARALASAVIAAPEAVVWHSQARAVLAWLDAIAGTLSAEQTAAVVRDFRDRIAQFPLGTTLVALSVIVVLRAAGRTAEAREIVEETLAFARRSEEMTLEAELLRLLAELSDDREEAAQSCLDAIASARKYGAHTFGLRAALTLAKLWNGMPREPEAIAHVAAALAQMQSGDAMPEVKAARALTAKLA
jgi:hypothetical protein